MSQTSRRIKRIVFVCAYLDGGIGRNIVRLSNYYSENEIAVSIWVGSCARGYFNELNGKSEVVELKTTHAFAGAFEARRLMNKFKPDVILTSNHRITSLIYNARKISRFNPLVLAQIHNVHSIEFNSLSEKKRKKRVRRMKKLYQKLDGIIAVSHTCANDFSQMACVSRDRVSVVLNPVIDDVFLSDREKVIEGSAFAKPTVLAVGHLVAQKNLAFLIDSFDVLRTQKDCQLVIVGHGPEADALQLKARASSFVDDIIFLGHKENPFPFMKNAQVFAMCSSFEGFGNVVVESLACGTPVVSTPCGGPEEIILNGVNGTVTDSFDTEEFANALDLWMGKKIENSEHENYLQKKFTVASVAEKYIEEFELLRTE